MKKIICECCNEDTSEYLNYELTSKDKKKITVCDSCYQEISILREIGTFKYTESVTIDGIEYFNPLIH